MTPPALEKLLDELDVDIIIRTPVLNKLASAILAERERLSIAVEALKKISDVASAFNAKTERTESYKDWELRAIAREALQKLGEA